MKERTFIVFALMIGIPAFILGQDLRNVATFPAVKISSDEKRAFPDKVAWKEAWGGDDIAHPFLIREGNSFGICDYLQNRVLWLKADFSIDRIEAFRGLGEVQGSGYRVQTFPNGAIYLFNDTGKLERKIFLELKDQMNPIAGGVWFQAETLFFFDMNGILHVIENPVESASVNAKNLKDASYVKQLLASDKTKRFEGLVWSDLYGLMRNGFPLATVYTSEWDRFFADKRKGSALQVNEKRKVPGKEWGPQNVFLLGIGNDGTVFWGRGPIAIIDSNGFFTQVVQWDTAIAYEPIILPSGDILLQSLKWKENHYDLYLIKRTW